MSPLLVTALRRMAWYAFGLTVALVLVFKVLPAFGVLGPSPEDHVGWASEALETARAYGARPGVEAFDAASKLLEEARRALAAGRGWQARSMAAAARAKAIEAQRAALVAREEDRRKAKRIVEDIDATLNALEDLYTEVSEGSQTKTDLLPTMRNARQTGAALFLAFDQQNFRRVIDDEEAVTARLAEAMATLEAARKKR